MTQMLASRLHYLNRDPYQWVLGQVARFRNQYDMLSFSSTGRAVFAFQQYFSARDNLRLSERHFAELIAQAWGLNADVCVQSRSTWRKKTHLLYGVAWAASAKSTTRADSTGCSHQTTSSLLRPGKESAPA